MAVAYDTSTESHTGTTGATGASSFTWNHTGGASARGALVFVFGVVTNALPPVTSVTYGGATMTAVPYTAIDTDTEPGSVRAYYLDNCGTGTKAVVVNRSDATPWAHILYAVCYTVTAAKATEVYTAGVKTQAASAAEQTAASSSSTGVCTNFGLMSITDGSPGTNSLRFMGRYQGTSNVTAAGTGSTAGPSIDFGLYVIDTFYESVAGQGARNVGGVAVSDDLAVIALAVREVPVDNRNANVVATGGGVVTEVGSKGGRLAGTATGGGVLVVSATGAHNKAVVSTGGGVTVPAIKGGRAGSATATGGGVSAVAPIAGRQSAVTATGGGVATIDYAVVSIENHDVSVVATGGGVAAAAIRSARNVTASATASGVATVAPVAGRQSSPVNTGGGVATVSQSAQRSTSAAGTGAGIVSLSVLAARMGAALMSGGGVLTTVQATARRVSPAATGAGAATVVAEQETGGQPTANVVATGGGLASIAVATARATALGLTGAGAATTAAQTARATALALTAGGSLTLVAMVAAAMARMPRASLGLGKLPPSAVRPDLSWAAMAGFPRREERDAGEGDDW